MLTFARFIFFTFDMGHGYAWVSVAVKPGPTTIHLRKIVKMGWENKFAELLVAVDPGLADTPISKICTSSNDKFVDPVHEVDITAPLSVSSVCIYLKEAIGTTSPSALSKH